MHNFSHSMTRRKVFFNRRTHLSLYRPHATHRCCEAPLGFFDSCAELRWLSCASEGLRDFALLSAQISEFFDSCANKTSRTVKSYLCTLYFVSQSETNLVAPRRRACWRVSRSSSTFVQNRLREIAKSVLCTFLLFR